MSADIQPVVMPKWGLAMQEGMVAAWLVEPGSALAKGAELVEIETSKITNVFEAPAGGLLRRLVAETGETVPVGGLLAVMAPESVADSEIDAFVADFQSRFAAEAAEAAVAAPEPTFVEVGGLRLRYLEAGDAPGVPVVFIHGYGGDHLSWMFNQDELAKGYRTLALDLPGHGGSAKTLPEGGLAGLAGTVVGFLDALGIDKAHLVGHSMGGAITLHLALDQPDRVASATLVCPGGLGPEINMDYIDGFVTAGRRKQMQPVLEMLFAHPGLVTRDMIEDVLRYKRLDGVETALRQLATALFPGGRQTGIMADKVARAQVPLQIVVGKQDRIIPAEQAEALAGDVPVEVLSDAGHMVHMEKPADVNRVLATFLGG